MRIGFIGTGTMGQPMLANLVKAGFAVTGYDVVPAALDAAVRLGATRASSVKEAAAAGDLIITMLPSSANVETVYLEPDGIAESAARAALRRHVDDRPRRLAAGRRPPQGARLAVPRRAGLGRGRGCGRRHARDHGRRRRRRSRRGAAGIGGDGRQRHPCRRGRCGRGRQALQQSDCGRRHLSPSPRRSGSARPLASIRRP